MDLQENKYKDYIKESYGREYMEDKYGFITYQFMEDFCVIHTLYVKPEYRQQNKGSELANCVAEKVKEQVSRLICEIDTRSKTYDDAYKAITGYGFKPLKLMGSYLILEKDISNG